jgi:hypothetical protein
MSGTLDGRLSGGAFMSGPGLADSQVTEAKAHQYAKLVVLYSILK